MDIKMEPTLEDWSASLLGGVESDLYQLLRKIGGEEDSNMVADDAIDACSSLW